MQIELEERRQLVKLAVDNLKSAMQTCLNCEHFSEQREICLTYNQRPPARVIAFGCPAFRYIVVPF